MTDLDLLAFYKFCVMFTDDVDIVPDKYYYDKFILFKNKEHIPHDYPMTCSKCIIDDCYEFAQKVIVVSNS